LLLTNAHVISHDGAHGSCVIDEALFEFEMLAPGKRIKGRRLIWSSPADHHDCSIIELSELPPLANLDPIPRIAKRLPSKLACLEAMKRGELAPSPPRVLVIGHPSGRDLEITFENNLLLDYDGPDRGEPFTAERRRVHYRAPTEPGSSGSPVFNAQTREL